MRTLAGGRVALSYISQAMLRETGAYMDETERISSRLRTIKGVEVAVLRKEEDERVIKVSMRSKTPDFDAGVFSAKFAGGGHAAAAGFTLYMTLDEAIEVVAKELEAVYAEGSAK